jgi:hypothetical protein
MPSSHSSSALAGFAQFPGSSRAVDVVGLDLRSGRPPAYQTSTAGYCLLVFGPAARTRMWLVLDGDSLFVDRSGTVERYPLQASGSTPGWRECLIGDVCELDGATRHRELRLIQTMYLVVLTLRSDGWGLKDIVWLVDEIQFARDLDQAPVVHFNGPLAIMSSLVVRGPATTLFARVGSMGVGKGTFACITPSIAAQVFARPVAELEFQGRGDSQRQRVELGFDC